MKGERKMANEKRLLDANALMEAYLEEQKKPGIYSVAKLIMDAPTVDAVEVVRCKDCHWWRLVNKRNGCGICSHETFSIDDCTVDPVTEPDDFCSYGERKDNERKAD
jgi:hypothetical protein